MLKRSELPRGFGERGGFCLFWLLCMACGILVPMLGIKPAPPVMKARSLNHWSAREVPRDDFYFVVYKLVYF